MKAMILAAGRGERMRPLTDVLPKPLLEVHGKALILWHIEKLVQAGFEEIVINIAHLGGKIVEKIGDGSEYGIKITYSDERDEGALESAGGIIKALPLLGDEIFLVVNGDVYSNYLFDSNFELGKDLAHLILVKNPEHNNTGDFGLNENRILNHSSDNKTFSGIAYYNPKLFASTSYGKSALAPILRDFIRDNKISGSIHAGYWHDIGTPQRLEDINKEDKC